MSKTVTTMLHHFDQEERQPKIKAEVCVIYDLFKDTLVVFKSSQNWWVVYLSLAIGKGTCFIEDFHGTSSPYWELDWFQEERRKIQPVRQSFWEWPGGGRTSWWVHSSADQNAVYWVRLSKAQDQGLEFWQAKSFAIMTHATILGDCSDRVTSHGDRVLFERLETPRLAPKVTLKKNWQKPAAAAVWESSDCATHEDGLMHVLLLCKHKVQRELPWTTDEGSHCADVTTEEDTTTLTENHKTENRSSTHVQILCSSAESPCTCHCTVKLYRSSSIPHLTQTHLASGNSGQKGKTRLEHKTFRTTPQKRISPPGNWGIPFRTWTWILISVTKRSTQMHSWRTKLWKKKSQRRIQEPLKESKVVRIKLVFAKIWRWSQESSQAIFEMGNVELIGLVTSRIQCPSCLHYVFKGTILGACGKLVRPARNWYDVSKQLLKFSKHPTSVCLWLLQGITNMALIYGRNTTTKQKTHFEVRKRTEEHLRRSRIDGKMTRPTGSLNSPSIGRMLGWGIWTTLQKLKSLIKCSKNKEVDTTIYFIYKVLTKIDRHQLQQQVQGTKKQRPHWSRCKGNRDKIWESHLSIGKDGINRAGRMNNGQSNGDRQHRLVFKMKLILASGNWGYGFKKGQSDVAIDKNQKTWPPSYYFFVAFRVQSDATAMNATVRVHNQRSKFVSLKYNKPETRSTAANAAPLPHVRIKW